MYRHNIVYNFIRQIYNVYKVRIGTIFLYKGTKVK